MNDLLTSQKFSSIAIPTIPVGHKDYVWYSHADTDVTRTWRRFGWIPLDEQRLQTQKRPAASTVRRMWQAK